MKIYVSASVKRSAMAPRRRFPDYKRGGQVAVAGDEVIVLPGYYREWVDPKTAVRPTTAASPTFQVPGGAVITGSEVVKTWEPTRRRVGGPHPQRPVWQLQPLHHAD